MTVSLPDISVEVGLSSANPTQTGTAFTLGDAANGKLGTGTLTAGISFTDVSTYVRSFSVTRTMTRVQGPLWNYQAGTCSIVLDNSDGSFDPDNLAGPFVSAGASQLVAMVPVRLSAAYGANLYRLYFGFADGWIPAAVAYQGDYAELTLNATDAFKVLAGFTLPATGTVGAGEDTGARVKRILTATGWYSSAEFSSIDTGDSTLQGTTYGADALSLIQIAVDSEIGQLYVNGSGAIVFRHRQALLEDARSNTPQAVFGDMPGAQAGTGNNWSFTVSGTPSDRTYFIVTNAQAAQLAVGDDLTDTANLGQVFTIASIGAPFAGFNNITVTPTANAVMASPDVVTQVAPQLGCAAINRANDDTTIVNDVQAARVGGSLQHVSDTASIARYLFPRTYPRSDLILQDDITTNAWAGWVLYVGKSGENRFESLAVDPQTDPANLWPQCLGREIGDRIRIWTRPAGVATPISKDCFIAGITHTFDAVNSKWLTTWTLQDASKYGSFLTLGNPTLGRLDNNALVF